VTIRYATGLDIGDRKRAQGGINEDSIAVNVLDDGHLETTRSAGVFALADGAGGENAGEVASYIASVEVTRRLTQTLWETRLLDESIGTAPEFEEAVAPLQNMDPDWILNAIETAIRSTHTRILQLIQSFDLESAYSTIVAGVKIGNRFYYGWVGDSRIYVINRHPHRNREQRISLLTRDHSLVQRLQERGEIDEVEAHVHQKGNQITRALGGRETDDPSGSTIQIETDHIRLFGDDIILFTSDGLIDAYTDAPRLHKEYRETNSRDEIEAKILDKSVTDNEIRDIVLNANSLDEAVDRFLALANRRGGKDNLSLILMQDDGLGQSPANSLQDRGYGSPSEPLGDRGTIIRDSDR